MRALPPRLRLLLLLWIVCCAGARAAQAFEYLDGRVQVHGYLESQLRSLSDGFRADRWYMSQWAQVLNLELEADLVRDGLGPIDSVGLYVRGLARFDCIWSKMCGLMSSAEIFGNRSNKTPGNLANGTNTNFTGVLQFAPGPTRAQNTNNNLVALDKVPPFSTLLGFGGSGFFPTIAPVADSLYGTKSYDGSIEKLTLPLGPWQPKTHISSYDTLGSIFNPTGPSPDGLPLRPKLPNNPDLGVRQAHNLYVPSPALVDHLDNLDTFAQNFSQNELQWNRGASQQQTKELKEAYLDIEMFEGRLFLRLGKQDIVWGKTELFPVVDQFNPYDFSQSNLPTLEESRIPLWSARAIYSFYDVGPLQDVRLELAANLDQYQPTDIGKCGEPYAAFLVCGKTFGLLIHGLLGLGLAGEQRPPGFWQNARGLEYGGRLEFRWERLSFALTDFYGYSDFPFLDKFNEYARKVDPMTGQPLAVDGTPLTPQNALAKNPANRQLFDVICSATGGLAKSVLPALSTECFLDLLNSNKVVALGFLTVPAALGPALAGNKFGETVLSALVPGVKVSLTELNRDYNDGPQPALPSTSFNALTVYLTKEQQALLGCGPYYGTNCDKSGIDLFNAEASVLLQAFPQFESGGSVATRFLLQQQGPVATRYVNGRVVTLPGARTIYDPAWNPAQDGCVGNAATITAARAAVGLPPGNAALCDLQNPTVPIAFPKLNLLAEGYTSEMQALSSNFLKLIAAFGRQSQGPSCDVNAPQTCTFVRAFFEASGTQRPEAVAGGNGRFGRRDFAWSSGAEGVLKYRQRNVLGFSSDFAEDVTKTNWGTELTWVRRDAFENSMEPRGFTFADAYNLTVSVDRPTFIHFVNAGRTVLFNMQWFFGYVPSYRGQGVFTANGPFSELGTFTIQTGYFQDRLLPSLTLVHDVGSNSGAILAQMTYRFTESFSATIGISDFYGDPQKGRVALRQIGLQNSGNDFMNQFRFNGLSAIAERDELFATLRYTF